MKLKHGIGWLLWVGLLIAANSQAVAADGSCDSYTWNVSKERALFAAPPTVVVASTEMNGAPRVRTGQLYELHLSLAPQIGELPGEAPRPAKYVGLVSVQIATSGRYRIALDNNAWVGMVSGISEEIPKGFQGEVACTAPRKLVEFDLSAGKTYLVQVSVSPTATMRLSITPATAGSARSDRVGAR